MQIGQNPKQNVKHDEMPLRQNDKTKCKCKKCKCKKCKCNEMQIKQKGIITKWK